MKVMFNISNSSPSKCKDLNVALLQGATCDWYERWERPVRMGVNKSGFTPSPMKAFVAGSNGSPGSLLIGTVGLVSFKLWERLESGTNWRDALQLEGFTQVYTTGEVLPEDIHDILEKDVEWEDPVWIFSGSRHAIRERLESAAIMQPALKDETGDVLFPQFHIIEEDSTSSAPFWETGVIPDKVRLWDDPTPIAAWLTRQMTLPEEQQHPEAAEFFRKWYVDVPFGVLVAQHPGHHPKYVYLGGIIARIGFQDGHLIVGPTLKED